MSEEAGAGEQCMGCRTAAGAHRGEEVYRDEFVVAVVSQHALSPGHLVVVSREHVRNALTMEEGLLAHMIRIARRLGLRLREVYPEAGVMLVFNNEAPCQTLFHAHLHVVPRYPGDAMDVNYCGRVAAEERAAVAARLRGERIQEGDAR